MATDNGTCPTTYTEQSSGVVLSAPVKGCDFNLTLGDEPDFFVTSHAPRDCQANLKMNVHSVCLGPSVSASNVLGQGSQLPGALALPGGLPGIGRLEAGDQAAVPQLSLSTHSIRKQQQQEISTSRQGSNGALSSCVQASLPLFIASMAVLLAAV